MNEIYNNVNLACKWYKGSQTVYIPGTRYTCTSGSLFSRPLLVLRCCLGLEGETVRRELC